MALADTARLAVRIDLEGNASAGIRNLSRQVSGLGTATGRIGRGVGQLGTGFARAGLFVGGAAVAGLGAAAKAAIDFEDAFAGVKKTVDEAELKAAGLSFEGLAKTFRDMATEIPIAATEFARLGETAGALGVSASDIDEFVKTTALLGVTTDLSADAAADALGRIGTILNFTGQDFEDFADSLVALGNAGASTESEIIEITKRFAAEGKAAGLATDDIAGLASATASLGFAPERGGTALARVFANLGTNISLANDKGKAFANLTGRSIKDLQQSLDSGQGLPIFLDVLEAIQGLSPTEANRTLKALGITNTSDRTIFRTMAANLPFVNEQLRIAANATGALSEEATKRFDTVASKIQLLKNNLIEAGITIGEGFAPAIGRAAEKLSAFLKQDANKSELKAIGEDIGEAIDGIDWDTVLRDAREFVGVLKSALSFVLEIVHAVNKLPTEIKAAAAGFLVLNKLSGGLLASGVGNVAGGLAGAAVQSLASRAPGIGKLFAQPVFVTNWPVGFGAGGGGGGVVAGGKGGKLAGFAKGALASAFAIPAIIQAFETHAAVNAASSAQAQGVHQTATVFLGQNPTTQELLTAMAGVDQGITDLQSNPLHMLVQGDALKTLQQTKADINTKLAKVALDVQRKGEQTVSSVDQAKATAIASAAQAKSAVDQSKALLAARAASTTSQVRSSGSAIQSTIRANRPIITVNVDVTANSFSKTVNVNSRSGPPGGSRDTHTGSKQAPP